MQPGHRNTEETKYGNGVPLMSAVSIAALLFLSFLLSFKLMQCDDHWWHILNGLWIIEHCSIPAVDPFSFTFNGQNWVQWEWLSGLVMALLWQTGGPIGLFILRFATLVALCVIFIRHFRNAGGSSGGASDVFQFALLVLLLLVIQGRLGDRPHFYIIPLFAAVILISDVRKQAVSGLDCFLIFVVFLFWANMHPSWLLGLGVIGAAAGDGLLKIVSEKRPLSGLLPHLFLLASAATGILSLLIFMDATQLHNAVAAIFADKVSAEWDPLFMHLGVAIVPTLAFFVLLFLWIPSAGDAFRRRRIFTVLFSVSLTVMAFRHVRFTVEAAVFAEPLIYSSFSVYCERLKLKASTRSLALLLIFVAGLSFSLRFSNYLGQNPGLGLDDMKNPVSLADFMQEHGCKGNLFATSKEAHGYFSFRLWPEILTFIDGRVPQVFPQSFLDVYTSIDNPEKLFEAVDKYKFDYVLLVNGLYKVQNVGVAGAIKSRGDFELMYFDESGAVFVRRGASCKECRPFVELDPWNADRRRIEKDSVLYEELQRLKRLAPDSQITGALLSLYGG